MSDKPTTPSDNNPMHTSVAQFTARETAIQAAVNILLDGAGQTGKSHLDILPSTNSSALMLSKREGGAIKEERFKVAHETDEEPGITFDVVHGSGKVPSGQKPEAREDTSPYVDTTVWGAGMGKIEGVTRASMLPNLTINNIFDANGDITQVTGKRCTSQQICDSAVLDNSLKNVGLVKHHLLKDSPNSRLIGIDVFKVEKDHENAKVGEIYLLERHKAGGRFSLDINVLRAPNTGQ